MESKLEKASKEIGKVFETQIKGTTIGAFYIAVSTRGQFAVSWNGTEEQKFTAIANFLCEHPEYIALFQQAIECAIEVAVQIGSENPTTSTKQFLN